MWFLPSRSHAAGAPCALGVRVLEPTRQALSVERSRIGETGVNSVEKVKDSMYLTTSNFIF